jgi:hypothetical protein
MPKLKVAALDVPELETVAEEPADKVVVVPTAMVAAAPVAPVLPVAPVAPTSPRGTVKLNTAADVVPELVTDAEVPGAPVVVVPAVTVAAAPGVPVAPVGPVAPTSPRGMVKLKTAALVVPEFVTVAEVPGAPVVVVPVVTVALLPGTPGATQDAGAVQTNVAEDRELTSEIDAQTTFVGLVGGVVDQPVGGTPTLVEKFHEPPVGVAGAVADSLKINHSKYVPPKLTVLPYKPTDSELP